MHKLGPPQGSAIDEIWQDLYITNVYETNGGHKGLSRCLGPI